jgi:hypothetical protein
MLIRATIWSCRWCYPMVEALCYDNNYINLPAFRGTGIYPVTNVRFHWAFSQYQLAWQYDFPLYTLGHQDSFILQLKKTNYTWKMFWGWVWCFLETWLACQSIMKCTFVNFLKPLKWILSQTFICKWQIPQVSRF